MRRILFAAVLLCTLAFAAYDYPLKPDNTKETGDASLPSLDVTGHLQCIPPYIHVTVKGNGAPLYGAKAYLFYTEQGYILRSQGSTNLSGQIPLPVTGSNASHLTHLFILRVDKIGEYKTKEIEFYLTDCVNDPHPNQQPPSPPAQNTTPPPTPPPTTPPANTTQPQCTTNLDCPATMQCNGTYTAPSCVGGKCTGEKCVAANGTNATIYCIDNLDCYLAMKCKGSNSSPVCGADNKCKGQCAACSNDSDCPQMIVCGMPGTYIPPKCVNGTCTGENCGSEIPCLPSALLGVLLLGALSIGNRRL